VNLGQLIKNKKVVYGGIGLAVVLGLYTLYSRTKGGAGVGEDATSSGGSAGQLNGTFPDTTGSNVASWFGQYSESVQRQLDEYLKQQQDYLESLGQLPTSPAPSGSTSPGNRFPRWDPPSRGGGGPRTGPIRVPIPIPLPGRRPAPGR